MEKQRMGAGRRFFCAGLLILFFSVCPYIYTQNSGTYSEVSVIINPETITIGNPFTLTLLVNYPVPEDVSVIAPPFIGTLSLDRLLKIPRVSDTGQIQTIIEFRLIPNTGGTIVLRPFLITTPFGITETSQIVIFIQNENVEQRLQILSFIWEGTPQQMTVGERLTITLRADDVRLRILRRENTFLLPASAFFMPEVPQGVILSQLPLTTQERERNHVLKLTLIPLEAVNFYLPARTLRQGNMQFELPALQIGVINK